MHTLTYIQDEKDPWEKNLNLVYHKILTHVTMSADLVVGSR